MFEFEVNPMLKIFYLIKTIAYEYFLLANFVKCKIFRQPIR